mgnify:CR=1 FL=1
MKKILYSVFALAIAAFTFTSCEDVPAPYDDPNDNPIDKPEVFEPSGSGTQADPFNVAAIIKEAEKLEEDEVSEDSYYFEGYVTSIKENYDYVNDEGQSFGNATLYISDDEEGSNSFYVYRAKYFDNKSYTSGVLPQEGDKVVFYGKLTNFRGTLETQQNACYLVSINGETGGSGEEPDEPITGENLLENGGFETWSSTSQPDNWKSTTTASSAKLEQSTDAHSGSYSVKVIGDAGSNKRLAYKEITLKAGTYQMSFYAKAVESEGTVNIGYVPVTDGKVGQYMYKDNGYTDLSSTEWTEVTNTFTLDATTTVNLVVMNSKSPGKDVLIDDFSLITNDGGLSGEQPEEPVETTATYALATGIVSGSKYVIATKTSGNAYAVATPLGETQNYGFLQTADATLSNNSLQTVEDNEFTITEVSGGYTIQDKYGRYYYMDGTFNNFNVATDMPSSAAVFEITFNSDNTVSIKNIEKGKTLQYDEGYNSYGIYEDVTHQLPSLFVKK